MFLVSPPVFIFYSYFPTRGLLSIRTIPGACTYSWRDQLSGKCVDDCLSLRFELEIDHEVVDYVVTEEHTASVPAKRQEFRDKNSDCGYN